MSSDFLLIKVTFLDSTQNLRVQIPITVNIGYIQQDFDLDLLYEREEYGVYNITDARMTCGQLDVDLNAFINNIEDLNLAARAEIKKIEDFYE